MASNPFTSLPVEMLLRIASSLTTTQYGHFRLTCRNLRDRVDEFFIKEFFTIKRFMLTRFSLNALASISQSRLGPRLCHLHIGMEDFRHAPSYSGYGRNQPDQDAQLFAALKADHELFRLSGEQLQLLKATLNNLTGLETVVLRHHNSERKSRNSDYASWSSYGVETVRQNTGFSLKTKNIHYAYQDHFETDTEVLMLLMQAFAGAPNCPLKGIEILSSGDTAVRDAAFAIPPCVEHAMATFLQRLEKLHVTMMWFAERRGTGSTRPSQPIFRRFLTLCPNLRDFRLNRIQAQFGNRLVAEFTEWLCSTDPSEVLPKLEKLSIGKTKIDPDSLLALLRRFRHSLRELALWRITFPAIKEDEDQHWPDFLRQMVQIEGLDSLRHVQLGFLAQCPSYDETSPCDVDFGRLDDGRSNRSRRRVAKYTGPDWRQFIKETIATLHVDFETISWHHANRVGGEDGDSSDFDGGGEEEEEGEEDGDAQMG